MKKEDVKLGLKIQSANDENVIFEITKTGLKDKDGFNAVEITFNDGTVEVAAVACIQEAVESGCKIIGE